MLILSNFFQKQKMVTPPWLMVGLDLIRYAVDFACLSLLSVFVDVPDIGEPANNF